MEDNVQKVAQETEIHITPEERNLEKRTKFTTRLLELDIASHILVLAGIVLIIGIYVVAPHLTTFLLTNTKANTIEPVATTTSKETTDLTQNLVRPVFANEAVLDPNQIFSYPPSKITLAFTGEPKKEIYGFLPYWMLPIYEKINISSLTTAALFALDVDGKGNIATLGPDGQASPGWIMWNSPNLNGFISQAKRKQLKVDLVIKSFSNANTESLVLSDDAQKTFIANTIYLVSSKGLDGVNLDFEYIGTPTKKVKDGFTRLIKNLRAEMKRQYPNLSLSIDTYVSEASIPRLIDIESLAGTVDAFIIMGYDFHTPNGPPGPIAPMEGSGYSLIGFLQSYLEKVDPEKLILAVAYYGYDWPSPAMRQGTKTLPYAQIAASSNTYTIQWDDDAQSPYYTYKDKETGQSHTVYFENPRSLGVKYDYVNRKNFKGVGIWALGYDGLNSDLRTLIVEKFSKSLTIDTK